MTVIKTNRDLTPTELYKLTRDAKGCKMSHALGSLTVDAYAIYNEQNNLGEMQEVLAILTKEGDVFRTISETFKREFNAIAEIFGDDLPAIQVVNGKTKAGRDFITVALAE